MKKIISRDLSIRVNNMMNPIEMFAKLMNIKNFLHCDDKGNETIDFSFYEKNESWFFYDRYKSVEDGFDFYIEINMYVEYNEFLQLLVTASKEGFDICMPDESSISPYIYDLFKNGTISKVLEETSVDDDTFRVMRLE